MTTRNRCLGGFSSKGWHLTTLVAFLSLLGKASGQPDVGICACAPFSYVFTLDFSSDCEASDLVPDDGIENIFCQISQFGGPGDNITDLMPAVVSSIQILEFDQDFNIVVQEPVPGDLFDGDTFSYESIVNTQPDIIPRVLQLNLFARNAAGEPIVNFFSVAFSNNCTAFPVVDEGYDAGWTQFTQLGLPSQDLCPAAPAPITPAPTTPAPATDAPVSPAPVTGPPVTDAPVSPAPISDAPVVVPTDPPISDAPATDAPVAAPVTDSPVTPAPVAPPVTMPPVTDAPATDSPVAVPAPTPMPTMFSMSMHFSMSMDMSMEFYDALLDAITEFDEYGLPVSTREFVAPKFERAARQPRKKNVEEGTPRQSKAKAAKAGYTKASKKSSKASSKSEKSPKSEKSSNSAKSAKSEKEPKSSSKSASAKSSSEKSAKAGKTEPSKSAKQDSTGPKKGKRRRLRLHHVI